MLGVQQPPREAGAAPEVPPNLNIAAEDLGGHRPATHGRLTVAAAGVLVVVLVVGGLVARGSVDPRQAVPSDSGARESEGRPAPAPGTLTVGSPPPQAAAAPPSDDGGAQQAEAAPVLALFAAQSRALRELGQEENPLDELGPGAVAERIAGHTAHIFRHRRDALEATQGNPGALRRYLDDRDHGSLARRLLVLETRARHIAVLNELETTLREGRGALAPALQDLSELRQTNALDPALADWADALLVQPSDRDMSREVVLGRNQALVAWSAAVAALGEPAAVAPLRAYVGGLDGSTLAAWEADDYLGGVLDDLAVPSRYRPRQTSAGALRPPQNRAPLAGTEVWPTRR